MGGSTVLPSIVDVTTFINCESKKRTSPSSLRSELLSISMLQNRAAAFEDADARHAEDEAHGERVCCCCYNPKPHNGSLRGTHEVSRTQKDITRQSEAKQKAYKDVHRTSSAVMLH